jgi:hypothetical protein
MGTFVEDVKAAMRGEYRVSKGTRGRIYARYGEGPPSEKKFSARPVLKTELKVMRADGRIENYRVGADGELIEVKPSRFPKLREAALRVAKTVLCLVKSLKARLGFTP